MIRTTAAQLARDTSEQPPASRPEPIGAMFRPVHTPDGWELSCHGHIIYADGSSEPTEFPAGVGAGLAALCAEAMTGDAGFAWSTATNTTRYAATDAAHVLMRWLRTQRGLTRRTRAARL